MELNSLLVDALRNLLTELAAGPTGQAAYVLNRGDRGLLESLRNLPADQASARPQGRSSIASHVRHLLYGFTLMNRWARGEDPFADADWSEAWRHQQVTEAEWSRLLADLGREVKDCRDSIGSRVWDASVLTATIGTVAHLAYHFGAIRQLNAATAGPRDSH
jgi:hypothetical protein